MSKMAEFEKIRDLFVAWAEKGVPRGVVYPRTQSETVGWKCPKFGVVEGVGSKSYFKSTHPEFGAIVKEIAALAPLLKPEDEVKALAKEAAKQPEALPTPTKRQYKTQKARRHAAEDKATGIEAENIALMGQLQATREELASANTSLRMERQTSERLRADVARLEEEKARLTRALATRSGILQLVE